VRTKVTFETWLSSKKKFLDQDVFYNVIFRKPPSLLRVRWCCLLETQRENQKWSPISTARKVESEVSCCVVCSNTSTFATDDAPTVSHSVFAVSCWPFGTPVAPAWTLVLRSSIQRTDSLGLLCVSFPDVGEEGRLLWDAIAMWWLWFVGSLKLFVSFAEEPSKRHSILQKRPMILRSLLIVATTYL